MKKISFLMVFALIAAVLAIGCGGGGEKAAAPAQQADSAPAAAPGPAVTGGGTVVGSVRYVNGDPDAAIGMDADPVCASMHPGEVHTEKVVTDDNGNLANVFIYVKSGLESKSFPVPATAHVLDQMGCQYQPHISGVQVGQKLVVRNSDPTLHNVHARPSANKEFNQGQPFQGMELEHTFDQAEVMVPFKCDVHPWMSSYMAVLDHPFFGVSDEQGGFGIENLPAGSYVLEAWHEEFGTQTAEVTVVDGEPAQVSFDFSPDAAASAG
ncbi:MAG: carboxypeptidase regulatory-like domain-containing protein [Thermoanaerobaculia bacterium]